MGGTSLSDRRHRHSCIGCARRRQHLAAQTHPSQRTIPDIETDCCEQDLLILTQPHLLFCPKIRVLSSFVLWVQLPLDSWR